MTEKEIRKDVNDKVVAIVANMKALSIRLSILGAEFDEIREQLHYSEGSLDPFWYETSIRDIAYVGDRIGAMDKRLEELIDYVEDNSSFRVAKK